MCCCVRTSWAIRLWRHQARTSVCQRHHQTAGMDQHQRPLVAATLVTDHCCTITITSDSLQISVWRNWRLDVEHSLQCASDIHCQSTTGLASRNGPSSTIWVSVHSRDGFRDNKAIIDIRLCPQCAIPAPTSQPIKFFCSFFTPKITPSQVSSQSFSHLATIYQ